MTKVNVSYIMKNYGDSKSIKVGFPHGFISEDGIERETVLKNVYVKRNGMDLEYTFEKETHEIEDAEFEKIFPGELRYLFDSETMRESDFIIFDLDMAKDETITLEIGYEVENFLLKLLSWGYMAHYTYAPYQFEFILTTSQNWKDGVIKDFEAIVEFKDFYPAGIELSPQQFTRESNSNIYVWKETDFKSDKNIFIKYYPPSAEFFYNKDARLLYYVTQDKDKYELPGEISEETSPRLYSIPPFFGREFFISTINLKNPDIKELDMFFETFNPITGMDSIIKVTLSQAQSSIDFSNQNFFSTLFAVPQKYPPISTEDLEIEFQYFKHKQHNSDFKYIRSREFVEDIEGIKEVDYSFKGLVKDSTFNIYDIINPRRTAYKIVSLELMNPNIKSLPLFFLMKSYEDGEFVIRKVKLHQGEVSNAYLGYGKVEYFGIPISYPKISSDDLNITIEYLYDVDYINGIMIKD